MTSTRPLLASILLAALAMGGIVLPMAHDVAHGAEREDVELAHSDHHHHQIEDDHGAEAQPYCPDAVDVELVCAFCSASAPATFASSIHGFAAPSHALEWVQTERVSDGDQSARSARGPPTA